MWPFNRKKTSMIGLPSEAQEYYQAERRERVGVAWLLAFATLLTTLLVAIGIFFGGRWAYRKAFKPKAPIAVQVKPSPAANQPTTAPTTTPSQPGTKPVTPQTSSTSTNTPSNQVAKENVSSDDNSDDEEATTTPSTPATTAGPLVKTGPADNLKVFILVSTIAAFAHNLVTRRRIQS